MVGSLLEGIPCTRSNGTQSSGMTEGRVAWDRKRHQHLRITSRAERRRGRRWQGLSSTYPEWQFPRRGLGSRWWKSWISGTQQITVSAAQKCYTVERTHARARAHTHTHTHSHTHSLTHSLTHIHTNSAGWRQAYMGGHDLVVAGGLPSARVHHHSERTAAKGNSVSQHVSAFHTTFRRLSTLCTLLSFAFTHSDPEIAFENSVLCFGTEFQHPPHNSWLVLPWRVGHIQSDP